MRQYFDRFRDHHSCEGQAEAAKRGSVRKVVFDWYCPSFVLSLNLSSVFKFNLSRAKQSLPKISTKFLSVCPSVCLSVCPSRKSNPLSLAKFFLGEPKNSSKNKQTQWLRPSDCAGGRWAQRADRRCKRSWGIKKNTVPKKLDEEEKFCMWVWSK